MAINKKILKIEKKYKKKINKLLEENGGTIPSEFLFKLKQECNKEKEEEWNRYWALIRDVEDITKSKFLEVFLRINGGEGMDFGFYLKNEKVERLRELYVEWSQQDGFQKSDFWNRLQCEEMELASDISDSIYEELANYIPFGDESDDELDLEDCFLLRDLNYEYLTCDGEKTPNKGEAESVSLYGNTLDCDFTETFDSV